METLILILSVVMILVGLYGAWPSIRGSAGERRPRQSVPARASPPPVSRPEATRVVPELGQRIEDAGQAMQLPARPNIAQPFPVTGLVSEVDSLRSQVELLRSEVISLSGAQRRESNERPRARRYSTGLYSYLPPALRREVRAVRHLRLHV